MTHDWWTNRRDTFDLFVSQAVIVESNAGDPDASRRRWEVLRHFPLLDMNNEVERLAATLMTHIPLPPKARTDALHIAVAAVHGMNYLLTWNCAHIANATLRAPIELICRSAAYEPPVICTPQEMLALGESQNG